MENSFKAALLVLFTFSILGAVLCELDENRGDEVLVDDLNQNKNAEPELDFREDFEFDIHMNGQIEGGKETLIQSTHYTIQSNTDVDFNLFRLKIKVFGCKRSDSLLRLINSLVMVDFQGETVDLDIYIDFPRDMYASSLDKDKIKSDPVNVGIDPWILHEGVISLIDQLKWPHGYKKVHERIFNVGVLGQWLEAWTPAGPHEYALFLEDDMEVSPYFYRWLKLAVGHYSRPSHPILRRVFGLSLQKLLIVSSLVEPRGFLPIENGNMPVAYQLTGTWGQVMFPGPWREFRTWFREHRLIPGFKPLVDNLINTQWYIRSGDDAWEQWVIRWAHEQGRFCIYSNFDNRQCLATNHRELGNNFKVPLGSDCHLVMHRNPDFGNFHEVPQFYNFSLIEIDPTTLPPLPEYF